MSVQVEKLEKNMAKLTIELSAEQFEDAMKKTPSIRARTSLIFQASVREKHLAP